MRVRAELRYAIPTGRTRKLQGTRRTRQQNIVIKSESTIKSCVSHLTSWLRGDRAGGEYRHRFGVPQRVFRILARPSTT